jgi:hypothetical protein
MGVMQALMSLAGAVVHPIPRAGGTGGMLVNWAIFAMMVAALLLSLRQRRQ